MKINNRLLRLEQIILPKKKFIGIFVEMVNGEIHIDEEKSEPDALRQLYHDLKLAYGKKAPEERS